MSMRPIMFIFSRALEALAGHACGSPIQRLRFSSGTNAAIKGAVMGDTAVHGYVLEGYKYRL